MKTVPLLLVASLMAVPTAVNAQTAISDEVCMGTALFTSDKAADGDTRRIVGMLEMYYLGKLRSANANLSLSDAVSKSVDAFGKVDDKGAAVKACIGGVQDDLVNLDTLNQKMSEKGATAK